MKLAIVVSGFWVMLLAVPAVSAQSDSGREHRTEQLMVQEMQREMPQSEMQQKRIRMQQAYRYQHQETVHSRLKQQQDDGFRMKGGSGNRR
ncbi:MAG: hypothetical protein R6X06_11635 [Gammaproteobacteria bacterium]